MKKKILVIAIVMCIATSLFLVACNNTQAPVTEYQVTFDENGGSKVATQKVKESESISTEPLTTKGGYTFEGWFSDIEFDSNKITFPYKINKDITLYAKWAEIRNVNFTFFLDNDTKNDRIEVAVGEFVHEPNTPIKADYSFLGWYDAVRDDANKIVFPYQVAKDAYAEIYFYAKWKLEVATVKFVTNCDEVIADERVNADESIELRTPIKEGYDFLGWYDSSTFYGSPIAGQFSPTSNTTLYAKWERTTYRISFDTDGDPMSDITVGYGKTFSAEMPYKNASVFEGWYDNEAFAGEALAFPYSPSLSMTIYAKWSPSTANSYFSFEKETSGSTIYYGISKASGVDLPTNVVIPSSYEGHRITNINVRGFADSNTLEGIWIGSNITDVRKEAFANCTALVNVRINDSVTSIGASAFEGCSSLTNFIVPKKIKYITYYTFMDCTSLEKVVLPEDMGGGGIDIGAFSNCAKLKDINLPDNIVVINTRAFNNCTSLESIIVPSKVKKLGESAFSGCTELKSIYIHKGTVEIPTNIVWGCKKIETITIEDGNEKYRSENESIIDIDTNTLIIASNGTTAIPVGIKKLEGASFNGLNITSIVIPSSITEIDYAPFNRCTSLESAVIEFDIDKIPYFKLSKLFYDASALKSVEIKVGTVILEGTFFNYKQLTTIIIPTTIKTIEHDAFYGCEGLVDFVVPEGVETIGDNTFFGCTNLISITLPSTFKAVEPISLFEKCDKLSTMTILATTPPLLILHYNAALTKIYVPTASVDSYRANVYYKADKIMAIE